MDMKKLISMSKKLDTFFKVLQKIAVIGMTVAILVTLILTIANMVNPNVILGENFNIVDIGSITIELAQELAPDNGTILTYVWILVILGSVCAAVISYAFGLVRKILQPMIEGRPFDSNVGHHIKKISYVALILGVVQNVASLIETIGAVQAFNLADLTAGGAVCSITANYTPDFSFLVLFFVLLLMSHIFNYGAELQQLSDETV